MTTAQLITLVVAVFGSSLSTAGLMTKILSDQIKQLGEQLGARIDGLGAQLGARIDGLGTQLGARIDAMGGRIDDVSTHLGARIDDVSIRMGQLEGRMTGQEGVLREMVKATASLEATIVVHGQQLDRISAVERNA